MGFKLKAMAGFSDKLEADYGCGIPSRSINENYLDYLESTYCKETRDICDLIFRGIKPSQIKCDCECEDSKEWEVIESLCGGELKYDDDDEVIEIADIALDCWCNHCGSDIAGIDFKCVNNATFDNRGFSL